MTWIYVSLPLPIVEVGHALGGNPSPYGLGWRFLLLEKPLGVWQQVTDKVAWGARERL